MCTFGVSSFLSKGGAGIIRSHIRDTELELCPLAI